VPGHCVLDELRLRSPSLGDEPLVALGTLGTKNPDTELAQTAVASKIVIGP
jgi:hypothetical protein